MVESKGVTKSETRPLLDDFGLLICQVAKVCAESRLSKLPSIPMVKLLYLCEYEYYRKYRRRLSGLKWIYYKYGPYAMELGKAGEDGIVEQESKPLGLDRCVKYWKTDRVESALHGDYIVDLNARVLVAQTVRPWAKRFVDEDANWRIITRELLNLVYHHTEPMIFGTFRRRLDFETIPPSEPTIRVAVDRRWATDLKRRLRAKRESVAPTAPIYPLPELALVVRDRIATALQTLNLDESTALPDDLSAADVWDDSDGTICTE